MADIIRDASGMERRCGTLIMPKNRVSSLPPFGSAPNQFVWPVETIKQVVTDSRRLPSRELFDLKWILDQLVYGSCNGHALAGVGARQRYRRGERDGKLFSGAYSYAKMNNHRDNGSVIGDDIEVCQMYGFCWLSLVPANQIYPEQQPPNADTEAAKNKGLDCYRLVGTFQEKLQALQTALAGPNSAIVAVHADDDFLKVNSFGISGVDAGPGNHAVLLDDLRWTGSQFLYDMANSWGTRYGQDGRGYLTEQHFVETFRNHEVVIVPSIDSLA